MLNVETFAAQPSEHMQQVALFMWASQQAEPLKSQLSLMFAIPNGGQRSKSQAAALKAEGVKAGVPDIFLPLSMNGYHGLFIELKKSKTLGKRGKLIGGGIVGSLQSPYHHALQVRGYYVATCHGFSAARDAILYYMGHIEPIGTN